MSRLGLRGVVAFLLALALAGLSWAATPTVQKGTIVTAPANEANMTDDEIAGWLGAVNANAKRLVILTECYGGNAAGAFTGTNTAVASATSPGETAKYGFYDSDAANALKPQAGKTGANVHNAGIASKHSTEHPTTGGGLGLASFPLDPVGTNNIESRHIIVYAGVPNDIDNAQRDKIKANNPDATVTSVGNAGTGGWDKPGTHKGLKDAIDAAAAAINGAANPGREQLILFITDHGDLHDTQTRAVTVPGTSTRTMTDVDPTNTNPTQNGLRSFGSLPSSSTYCDTTGWPVDSFFNVFFDLSLGSGSNVPTPAVAVTSAIQPAAWTLLATPSVGSPSLFTNPLLETLDYDGSGTVGDSPGEGVTMSFTVPSPQMISSFFDVFVELDISNGTANSWIVSDPSQSTGDVAKTPEPACIGLLALGLLALRRTRKS